MIGHLEIFQDKKSIRSRVYESLWNCQLGLSNNAQDKLILLFKRNPSKWRRTNKAGNYLYIYLNQPFLHIQTAAFIRP